MDWALGLVTSVVGGVVAGLLVGLFLWRTQESSALEWRIRLAAGELVELGDGPSHPPLHREVQGGPYPHELIHKATEIAIKACLPSGWAAWLPWKMRRQASPDGIAHYIFRVKFSNAWRDAVERLSREPRHRYAGGKVFTGHVMVLGWRWRMPDGTEQVFHHSRRYCAAHEKVADKIHRLKQYARVLSKWR